MNKNIEQALSGFSYDEQRRMRDVITALDNGKVYSVDFYGDGSGVAITKARKYPKPIEIW